MNTMIDSSLSDLALFVRVADSGGFTAASKVTKVPQATISRRIADLEDRINVRLFNRTTRSVALTDAGHRIYIHAKQMLEQAEAAAAALASMSAHPSGTLRLTCTVIMGQSVIKDILTDYLAAYPEVNVKLEATSRRVDLVEEGFDIAIRIGRLADSGLAVTRLGNAGVSKYASPEYLATVTKPQTPADLVNHPLFMLSDTLGPRSITFSNETENIEITIDPRFVCNDVQPILNGALNHLGIVILPRCVGQSDEYQGKLIEILPDWHLPSVEINALTPSYRGSLPAVKAFIEMLKTGLKDMI